MEKNEGKVDRITRSLVGIALLTFGFFFAVGIAKPVCLFFGTTTIISAIMGWCPLYIPFGVNTCGGLKEKNSQKD